MIVASGTELVPANRLRGGDSKIRCLSSFSIFFL